MLVLKNENVRVRCVECKESQYIKFEYIGKETERRTIDVERQYIYRGENNCTHCENKMRILAMLYEFPTGIINYIDTSDEGCLIMEDLTEDSIEIK